MRPKEIVVSNVAASPESRSALIVLSLNNSRKGAATVRERWYSHVEHGYPPLPYGHGSQTTVAASILPANHGGRWHEKVASNVVGKTIELTVEVWWPPALATPGIGGRAWMNNAITDA
jgi:hypothetical protein